MSKWTFDSIPDQSGRRVVVTGSNTGIGFEAARQLALKGAEVVICSRSVDKGREAMERIRQEAPQARVCLEQLDLGDLDKVKDFAARVKQGGEKLDLLILNAGVMVPPEGKTVQGFETQFGVNHLGHFALTAHLLPLLQSTEGSRVVVLSSTAATRGKMDFEDLHFQKRGYHAWAAYGQSKLANQLFTRELQRRLDAAGSKVLVTAAHPGWTATDLQRTSGTFRLLNPIFAMKPPQGALPTLRAATDPAARGADYFGPGGIMQVRGYPQRVDMVKLAMNDADARRLWEVSEELTGVEFGLPG